MKITYDLEQMEEFREKWIGKIVVNFPKYKQRLQYIKDCNFQTNEAGEITVGTDQIESIIKLVEIAGQHVEKVAIEHLETGLEVGSFEELEDYEDTQEIINVIGGKILAGVRLGEI